MLLDPYDDTMKPPTGIVIALCLTLAACGGDDASRARGSSSSSSVLLDDVRSVLPANWAIENWVASSDGRYVALSTVGHTRARRESYLDPDSTGGSRRSVGLYRRDAAGMVEIARWLTDGLENRALLSRAGLEPDKAGDRVFVFRFRFDDVSAEHAVTLRHDGVIVFPSTLTPAPAPVTPLPPSPSPAVTFAPAPFTPFPVASSPAESSPFTSTPASDSVATQATQVVDPVAESTVVYFTTDFIQSSPPGSRTSTPAPITQAAQATADGATAGPTDSPWTPLPPLSFPAGALPAGWRLRKSAWSADHRQVAVLTTPETGFMDQGLMDQLSVYTISGARLIELWREVNYSLDLDEELAFRDVNRDGSPDVVYTTDLGGTGWTNSPTLALSTDADGVRDIVFRMPIPASAPERPVDIDGDGVYEWWAGDASWELQAGFCHSCSPSSQFILAWDGETYVDATARFLDAILGTRRDPSPPSADASCYEKDLYLSELVSRYLTYFNTSHMQDAERIRVALLAFDVGGELAAKRDAIAAALVPDPHFPRLRYDYWTVCRA